MTPLETSEKENRRLREEKLLWKKIAIFCIERLGIGNLSKEIYDLYFELRQNEKTQKR